MSDIVDRLTGEKCDYDTRCYAASEIAILRLEKQKLRAALEEIASVKLYSFGLAHEDGAIVHEGEKEFMLRRDARAICDIARAALAQGGEA